MTSLEDRAEAVGIIEAALTAAREEGRRQGLEEAAGVTAEWSSQFAVQSLAEYLRALARKGLENDPQSQPK